MTLPAYWYVRVHHSTFLIFLAIGLHRNTQLRSVTLVTPRQKTQTGGFIKLRVLTLYMDVKTPLMPVKQIFPHLWPVSSSLSPLLHSFFQWSTRITGERRGFKQGECMTLGTATFAFALTVLAENPTCSVACESAIEQSFELPLQECVATTLFIHYPCDERHFSNTAQHLNAGFQNSCGHCVGVVKSSNIESEMPSLQSAARGAKPPLAPPMPRPMTQCAVFS